MNRSFKLNGKRYVVRWNQDERPLLTRVLIARMNDQARMFGQSIARH